MMACTSGPAVGANTSGSGGGLVVEASGQRHGDGDNINNNNLRRVQSPQKPSTPNSALLQTRPGSGHGQVYG
jgi:hypothetical protein